MKRNLIKWVLLILVVLLSVGSAQAQQNHCEVPDVGLLSPNEFKTKISLTHVWQGAVGGVNTKNSDRTTGLYDLDLYYLFNAQESENNDGDYLLFCVSTQAAFGNGITTDKVGGPFELNENAKGNLDFIVDKVFAEFTLSDRLFTVDIGKIDLEDFFDTSAVAGCEKSQFLARPLLKNETIPFPSKGLGIRAIFEPSDFWYVQVAIADAQADKRETGFKTTFCNEDYFVSMAEIGIRPNFFNMPGTYRFIIWYDPQDKAYLDGSGSTKRDDLGFALSFDQKISKKTTVFCRYGWADDKVNSTEDFVSVGGQIEGLIEGRDKDVFAIGYAHGLRSPKGLASNEKRQIDLIETYYAVKVNDNISITPNIQFVMDPGGLTKESPATVFGLRCRVKF
ncbi:MAG: carbohydrate porin [Planctomycetes bacterium]|nr:carbohydrate porin [Planctomycetota bacterium]MCK5473340.1 carbohydrate porin [Planctomycetota bacterium]